MTESDANGSLGEVAPFARDNANPTDYTSRGQTTVATLRGYAFVPADKELPVITHEGIQVTADIADTLVSESDGVVFIVNDKEGE